MLVSETSSEHSFGAKLSRIRQEESPTQAKNSSVHCKASLTVYQGLDMSEVLWPNQGKSRVTRLRSLWPGRSCRQAAFPAASRDQGNEATGKQRLSYLWGIRDVYVKIVTCFNIWFSLFLHKHSQSQKCIICWGEKNNYMQLQKNQHVLIQPESNQYIWRPPRRPRSLLLIFCRLHLSLPDPTDPCSHTCWCLITQMSMWVEA